MECVKRDMPLDGESSGAFIKVTDIFHALPHGQSISSEMRKEYVCRLVPHDSE